MATFGSAGTDNETLRKIPELLTKIDESNRETSEMNRTMLRFTMVTVALTISNLAFIILQIYQFYNINIRWIAIPIVIITLMFIVVAALTMSFASKKHNL